MRSCNKVFTITEYSGFTRGIKVQGYQTLPEKTFDALEAFILANTNDTATGAVELLSLSVRRNIGKVITARNYVGLITMSDGTVIEILPKIADGEITVSETKQIFLEMLKTLNDVNFKDFNVSSLHTERLSLLEIFIKMFLDEVTILTKQGLKAAYTPIESNEKFFKGKLLASKNLKHNLVNKERFFVRYDDFNINRPENRLIKSTISFLLKSTSDVRNRQLASRLLTYFDKVGFSTNYEGDFSRCFADRSVSHYQNALSWCRVLLRGNSFTAFAGSEVALALLFPMEKVFESFISARFRKNLCTGINMRTQDNRYSLFDSPIRAFALRPDIVLEFDGRTIVLDTKWKLLTDSARNKGISQSDMYQMYAYSKKYEAEGIVLVYPNSNLINRTNISFASDDNVKVSVSFIDLRNVEGSISKLVDEIVNVS